MKCPRCQHENRPTAKFCENCATPLSGASPSTGSDAHLNNEIETLRRALSQSLEQQTATSDILRVISQSQTDLQPIFDTIAVSALRLCGGDSAAVFTFDGELIHVAALRNFFPEVPVVAQFPMPPGRGTAVARAILTRRVEQIEDARKDPDYVLRDATQVMEFQSVIAVPMLQSGRPIGAVSVGRAVPGPFSDKQIALLQTFADQAVIAIGNVRLFKELEEGNRTITEALEQQTATAEILKVISRSPTDIEPVLESVAESAARLCQAADVSIFRVEGARMRLVIHRGPLDAAEVGKHTIPIAPGSVNGEAVLERRTVHVTDLQAETDRYPAGSAQARQLGWHTMLSAPLLRENIARGVIVLRRAEIRPFTDKQVALLETFADQAVIAIENVRLFKELEARNTDLTAALARQTATSDILRVISSSPTDVQPVFNTIVESAVTLCDGLFGGLVRFDGELIYPVATHNYNPEALDALHKIFPARPNRILGVGRAILDRDVVHLPDVELDSEYQVQNLAGTIGFRSGLFVPVLRDGAPVGAILVARAEPGPFSDHQIALLKTFANQAVIAIENVRLFNELQAANRDLTAASQHKSEFLASMSHELRTPLNAILGFSELLSERLFGELNAKQDEYLKDIHASGQHLLSLINDILDLSKIEAGRMELELTDFDLPTAIDNALTLVRERASRRGIALHQAADEGLGQIRGDERKIKQVLLNLLSNAIKFTPHGGRIDVRAIPVDGSVEVSVSDTGVGIAPEDQEAIFEEFRQVGTADKKVEGTGLGLALSRKFVELHGGRIWVKSQVGTGSTFTFTVPVRRSE